MVLHGRDPVRDAHTLLITADAGGSNGSPFTLWKVELAKPAAEAGLAITVCHYPPGTSKWNKIEHRIFSFIAISWRGRPLVTYRTIIELISAATTTSDLKVRAECGPSDDETGVQATKPDQAALRSSAMSSTALELHTHAGAQHVIEIAASPYFRVRVRVAVAVRWVGLAESVTLNVSE